MFFVSVMLHGDGFWVCRHTSAEQAGGAVVSAQLPHAILVWLL